MFNKLKKYIPFTEEFNKKVIGSLKEENNKIIFLIILLVFIVCLLGFVFKPTINLTIIILGGFLLIGVAILILKKSK